jgi:hypothetical protein
MLWKRAAAGFPRLPALGILIQLTRKLKTGKCPDPGGLFQGRTEFISGKRLGALFQFA